MVCLIMPNLYDKLNTYIFAMHLAYYREEEIDHWSCCQHTDLWHITSLLMIYMFVYVNQDRPSLNVLTCHLKNIWFKCSINSYTGGHLA